MEFGKQTQVVLAQAAFENVALELGHAAIVVRAGWDTAAPEGRMAVLAVQDILGVEPAEVDVSIVVAVLVHFVALVEEVHGILAGKSALDNAAAVDNQAGH